LLEGQQREAAVTIRVRTVFTFRRTVATLGLCVATGAGISAAAATLTTVYTFGIGAEPCCHPGTGPLARDAAGNLYGGFSIPPGSAPIYEASPPATAGNPWTATTIRTSGSGPEPGRLLIIGGGKLLGTTAGFGSNSGTAFELTPPASPGGAWGYLLLHQFAGAGPSDGAAPAGGLLARSGFYYGVTSGGGAANNGIVYSLKPRAKVPWTETIIYNFPTAIASCNVGTHPNGQAPQGELAIDSAGALYGATMTGGLVTDCSTKIGNMGTVFRLAPPATAGNPWAETVLYAFSGVNSGDGSSPLSGPVMDSAGALYGTTNGGGTASCLIGGAGCGIVYKLTPAGGGAYSETVLHAFLATNGGTTQDGAFPSGRPLLVGTRLFGVTPQGGSTKCGSEGCGVIFELRPGKTAGTYIYSVVYEFQGGADGCNPYAGLIRDSSTGLLYGTTDACGSSGEGTIFSFLP
jgi:uncharacterized repeat protein (TIGR03803 family)